MSKQNKEKFMIYALHEINFERLTAVNQSSTTTLKADFVDRTISVLQREFHAIVMYMHEHPDYDETCWDRLEAILKTMRENLWYNSCFEIDEKSFEMFFKCKDIFEKMASRSLEKL